MGLMTRLKASLTGRERGERDAPSINAGPRDSGGVEQPNSQDRNSSTGTSSNETFVGRAGGDESGDVEASGGERRAGHVPGAGDGAARDDGER
jgi:hypothetical protein